MGTPIKTLRDQVFAELGGTFRRNHQPNATPIPQNPAQSQPDDLIPEVNVELTEQQFDTAVRLAKQWFVARKGFTIYRPVQTIDGVNDYQMQSDVQQVLDVIFNVPEDVAAFFSLGFFDLIPYGPQNIGSIGTGLTNYSGFAQLIQFNEQRKRVFSVTPEWWFEQQTQILHITNRKGSIASLMFIEAKVNDFDPVNLQDKDDWIFGRWVRAKSKEIVGRIRSKYDSLPAAGGNLTLDGKDLIAEAKEEFIELDKEIFASQGPDAVIVG